MKYTFLFLCLSFTLMAQERVTEWTRFSDDLEMNIEECLDEISKSGLDISNLDLISYKKDDLNFHHYTYQQYHQGVKVYNSIVKLHEREGRVVGRNGHFWTELNTSTKPFLNEKQALDFALDFVNAEKYAWENNTPGHEGHDHSPTGELVVLPRGYFDNSRDRLVYTFSIYAVEPLLKKKIFVDAVTGEIVFSYNDLKSCFDQGTAHTKYYGAREIETTNTADGFILLDQTRGGGIHTTSVDSSEYLDSDNEWEEGGFAHNEAALDVFWGSEVTYDYLLENFNHNGLDGQGSLIRTMILEGNVNNAFWNGSSTLFGKGDTTRFDAFTSIDIVAHEMTHGVTEFSAGLEYIHEAGALNESFSDLFGKAVEFEYDSANFSWELGDKIVLIPGNGFRNMEDPNLYRNPKYYKGRFWVGRSFDNGGVHFNSGVMNHWFYLLCSGVSGTNEAGMDYDVPNLGFEKTMQIAFRSLTTYLTPTSQYIDARQGSLWAAADLYGLCSDEYKAVAEAWFAVGVGGRVAEGDLVIHEVNSVDHVCGDGLYSLGMRVMNNSCNTSFPIGTPLEFVVSLDGEEQFRDTTLLTQPLEAGGFYDYSASQDVWVDNFGNHLLQVDLITAQDTDSTNNSFLYTIQKLPSVDNDFQLFTYGPTTVPCDYLDSIPVRAIMVYQGCSVIPQGTKVDIGFDNPNYPESIQFVMERSAFNNAFVVVSSFANEMPHGFVRTKARLEFLPDTVLDNNVVDVQMGYLKMNENGYLESFDDGRMDSSRLFIAYSLDEALHTPIRIQEESNDFRLTITGADLSDPEHRLFAEADPEDFFNRNADFQVSTGLCFNPEGHISPHLEFDYASLQSEFDFSTLGVNPDFSTMMRISYSSADSGVVRESPIALLSDDANFEHFIYPLPIDKGELFIEIQTLTLSGSFDTVSQKISMDGDVILLDNIEITDESTSIEDKPKAELLIKPNPTSSGFIIGVKEKWEKDAQLRILDQMGKEIWKEVNLTSNKLWIGSEWNSGIYFAILSNGKGIVDSKKLIKIE